ncbi:MAG: D-alanyl-D-alanine carboxypeptidase [Ruminococcus sp.]|nr:D-alanyl-D-alanine carboxypeptidase [Ruminococcus sp.]
MKIFKRLLGFLAAAAVAVSSAAGAAGEIEKDDEIYAMLEAMPVAGLAVIECGSGKMLYEKAATEQMPMGHLAKLMTLLFAAESLENGGAKIDDLITVSDNAGSKGGISVWLERGEKISFEEALKAVTVSNANDACTALAEYLSGSEESFVEQANSRCMELGLKATHFSDCCGLEENTVSNAAEIALISAELVRHELLTPFVTCWMDQVREGKAQLVNRNRLVRTYKGIRGLKECYNDGTGECAAAAAERGGMTVAVVALGCDTQDSCTQICKKMLDLSFEHFSVFRPIADEEWTAPIPVAGGVRDTVRLTADELRPIVVSKGSTAKAEIEFKKTEVLQAPVKKGTVVGTVVCRSNDEVLYSLSIRAAEDVEKMNFRCGFLKLVYNLLSF